MSEIYLKAADLEVNLVTLAVTRENNLIQLRRKEWQLLAFLLRHPGQVLSRRVILDHVWQNSYDVYPGVVDVHIKYLRDKIDRPFAKPLIKTVHGWGYKLEV